MPHDPGGGGGVPWVLAVLHRLGAPHSPDNQNALSAWAASEGMPAGAYNWLATTRGGYGGYRYNSAGVWGYPDFATGVRATCDTILQKNMRGIAYELRHDDGLLRIWYAINGSPWCGGCQHGNYPVVLYNLCVSLGLMGNQPIQTGDRPVQEPTGPPQWEWSALVAASADQIARGQRGVHSYGQAIRRL